MLDAQAKNKCEGCQLLKKGAYWGIKQKKKWVLEPIFDTIYLANAQYAIVKLPSKGYGIYSFSSASIQVPCQYDTLVLKNDSLCIVRKDYKYGVVTTSHKQKLPLHYKSITINSYNIVQAHRFHRYKFIGFSKDTLEIFADSSKIIFDTLLYYAYNQVHNVVDKIGEIRFKGSREDFYSHFFPEKMHIPIPTFNVCSSDSFCLIVDSLGFWGLVGPYEDTLITPSFDSLYFASDTLLIYKQGSKFGLVDVNGSIRLAPYADSLIHIKKEFFKWCKDGFCGIVNKDGLLVSDTLFHCMELIPGTKAFKVTKHKTIGVLAYNGLYIVPATHSLLHTYLSEEVYTFRDNDRYWGIVDEEGRQLLDTLYQFQEICPFYNGYARVMMHDYYGHINKKGGLTIATQYKQVEEVSENRCGVKIKDKWAVVDGWENMIAQPYYSHVGLFKDSVCVVAKNNKYGLIDYYGNELFEPKYDRIYQIFLNVYVVYKGKKAGLVNKFGKEYIYTKYDSIASVNSHYIVVSHYGKIGLINYQDQWVAKPEYESILLYDDKKIFALHWPGSRDTYWWN